MTPVSWSMATKVPSKVANNSSLSSKSGATAVLVFCSSLGDCNRIKNVF